MIRGLAALAAASVAAACSARHAPEVTQAQPVTAGSAVIPAASDPSAPIRSIGPITSDTTQLLTAIVDDWTATTATLQLWRRTDAHAWTPSGAAWTAVIGATGAAWGDGRHGRGAPTGHDGPTKHEGDGKSPAGVFELRATYGYAAAPPPGTSLPYTKSDAALRCVDDPRSAHYAELIEAPPTPNADWSSAEIMRRPDALYTWVIDVAHNPDRARGDGSCIFLHVWSGPRSTTVGCTAMPEPVLAQLIATLDVHAHPLYVLLPRAEYAALQRAWDLPAL